MHFKQFEVPGSARSSGGGEKTRRDTGLQLKLEKVEFDLQVFRGPLELLMHLIVFVRNELTEFDGSAWIEQIIISLVYLIRVVHIITALY